MTQKDTGGQAYLRVKAVSAIWHLDDIVKSSVCTPTHHLSEFEPIFSSGRHCLFLAKGLFNGRVYDEPSATD